MPKIFPYNLFTMKKLIKREVYPKRIRDLNEEQDEQLQILKQGIDRNYGPQRADFERRLAEYERKLAQGDGTTASGVAVNSMRRTPEPAAGPIFGHSPAIATPLIATVDGLDGSPAPGKEEDEKTSEFVTRAAEQCHFDSKGLLTRLSNAQKRSRSRSGGSGSTNRCGRLCTALPRSRTKSPN